MIQLESCGHINGDSESSSAREEEIKEESCDDKENSIDISRKRKQRKNNLTDSSIAMADCEALRVEEEGEDVNGNLEENGKSIAKDEPDDENVAGDENEMEPGEISFSQSNAMDLQAAVQAQSAASAVLNEANAIFNNAAMFQPGQMSMQTFQNAIAQFTANAIANNMDNETVMKNLAILQSALFTLQQQQFLQFQLIQHLQSQLVNKKGDSDTNTEKPSSKCDSDDDDSDRKMKDDIDEEDGDIDELEDDRQNQIRQRIMETKHFTKMQEALMKENESRNPKSKSHENGDVENILKKAEEGLNGLNAFTSNFSLASNIITDHDPAIQISESTNSLAMLEKKAQEVLNSASQGILSNNLLDELAFANDKASPNGRTDSSLFKHRCRYCGKIFGSDSSLQIHIRSHTGERPYKCNVCGSRFTTKGNLKVHFQRHSDKYPHIPMNPNPVPEHLDKYFPPLVPSEALKEMPNAPPTTNPPFPNIENRQFPQRGFFPDFYFPRPPIELFGPVGAGEAARNPVDLSQMKKPESPSFRLSPEVMIHEEEEEAHSQQTIKEEPEDETLDLSDKSHKNSSSSEKNIQTTKPPAITQPLHISSPNNCHQNHQHHRIDKDEQVMNERSSRINRHEREREKERDRDEKEFSLRMKNNSVENLAKVPSVSPPSSSSSTSGSLYQDTVLDPSYFSAHLPRPDSNDSSWENFIEISSETSKLQELVDNIDNKNIEPNQCLVCKKVLSCRSALQMHYRVHTGERPFRCKICGRSFTTKGNLKTHMSVHRIKPPMRTLHQCPVCHQKFSNIFVLQQHIRLHTGEMTDLTPDQIRAAEIREFPEIREHTEMKMPPFGIRMSDFPPQKRSVEQSDDENNVEMTDANREREQHVNKRDNREIQREKSQANKSNKKHNSENHREGIRVKTGLTSPDIETHVEDLRAMNLQRLSVHSASNDDYSRDSSPVSPSISEAKRLRSSSPSVNQTPPSGLSNRSPIATPPSTERPPFPYGPHFLGIHQFPPFVNRPPFMANVPIVPSSANMPPFGLFGVRGNTTTCNICFKTFACNSALEIHYRSHTKERPYKCSICDRGFSTKGNMKQHMLTHKIRDMFGNSNSGDESRMSSGGGQTSDSQSTINNNQQINFAIKLENSRSPNINGVKNGEDDEMNNESVTKENEDKVESNFSALGQKFTKEPDIKKWCNKLNEMPENIAAS
ncbi:CLUMA_CG014196, isoform A [Clunio marinus]|uniref:CLUMA_CG014196, isoform A n=1 Tax=Clunio marinus TaxID=568069 RepID=A0A1J1INV1_9DIPT|nr:CLUMA_CG014196, isoform A [Clunio marinus]